MWISVTVETGAMLADALSDALIEAGAISASVEDADAGSERETPQFGEPGSPGTPLWQRSRVLALFEPAPDLLARVRAAAHRLGITELSTLSTCEVAEQDWVRLTQAQFEPIRIDARLWIVPSWHLAPDPAATNLVLDPGLAFGTGSHPTTALCLQWLCRHIQGGETLLDYGCGSGILAIAARRLGAARVLAVDIDDNALIAARDNAERNAVDIELQHSRVPLQQTFAVVLANILTNPLCVLAPLLGSRVAPGGSLVLAGVLASQADRVIDAYAATATPIALRVGDEREGWVRLEGQRSQPC